MTQAGGIHYVTAWSDDFNAITHLQVVSGAGGMPG
jgi:hypothetical protein